MHDVKGKKKPSREQNFLANKYDTVEPQEVAETVVTEQLYSRAEDAREPDSKSKL